MKLVVDIGNTNIKWRDSADTRVQGTEQWRSLVAQWASLSVTAIDVSCVKSEAWREEFAQTCRDHLGIVPRFAMVRRTANPPRIAYRDLASFGVDRWLGLLAASARVPSAYALVSAGSAITVDFVAAGGRHLGGMIAPGLAMSATALDRGTGGIGRQEWTSLNWPWQPGDSTAACVNAGLCASFSGLMAEVCKHPLLGDGGGRLILTGGDAKVLRPLLERNANVCVFPFLVLDGLQLPHAFPNADFQ